MTYGNRGYIGASRSVRSQEAINNGLLTYSQLHAWQKRAVTAGAVEPCEWHHTGKYLQETDYYNPEDFATLNPEDFPPAPKKKDAEQEPAVWYVLVAAEWAGSKNHRKIVGVETHVTDKPTQAQLNARKYSDWGGYIKTYKRKCDATRFAKTAKLKQD